MGIGSKEKINDSVKEDKQFLDKEKDKKEFNEISKRGETNDSKDDKRKSYDNDNTLIQEIQEERKESKWGKIDWNKDISDEKKESKSNSEHSGNKKIEGYINDNLKDTMIFVEVGDKKIKGLKDFNKDFEAKEIEEVFLEEKKDKLENKYVGEKCFDEFKKETDEEGVEVDLLTGKKQKLEERENDLGNLNDVRVNKEKVDIKNEINEKNYENLLNNDLHKNFKEPFNETNRYANWGTKIRKDFINKIDNEINNKSIKTTERDLLKQIKQMCDDIKVENIDIKIEIDDRNHEKLLKEYNIYLVVNTIEGKVYIGKTKKDIEERWRVHLDKAKYIQKKRENGEKVFTMHFTNALIKYGEEIWKKYRIDIAFTENVLNQKEKYWIALFHRTLGKDKVYNVHDGGTGGKPSEDTKLKMSSAMIQKWKEDEFKERNKKEMSNGMKSWWSNREHKEIENHCNKMSNAMIQKWKEDEFKEGQSKSMSKRMKKKWKEDEYKENKSKSMSKRMKQKWKEDEFKEEQSIIISKRMKEWWSNREENRKNGIYLRNPIQNKAEFLIDIQELTEKELIQKYNKNPNTIRKNIQYFLGKYINTLRKARKYLKNRK